MNLFIDSLIKVIIRYPKFMESALLKKIMFSFPNKIANKYDRKIASKQDYDLPLNEGLRQLNINSDFSGKILDICSGTGFASLTAAHSFPKAKIIGIDQSSTMVSLANEKANFINLENIKFLKEDAFRLPFKDNSFDIVMVSNAPFYFDEAVRVLKPNGKFLISMSFGGKGIVKSTKRINEYFQKYNLRVIDIKKINDGAFILSILEPYIF